MKVVLSLVLLSTLCACASAPPVRYYTLVRPLDSTVLPSALSGVDLISVKVPAQVDHPQLVVRQGAERVEIVETQQWIAPLPAEIRAGLTERLDVRVPASAERLRLALEITRFESVLGSYALIETHWQLRSKAGEPLNCSTRSIQKIEPGFEALVAGHQRALDQIADDIASGARQLTSGASRCPV